MRITNNIIINNSLSSINSNKVRMDKLYSQVTSEKKIQRPSEDPIVAIRALRLRSSLSEIGQYLDKNIPDASAWMQVTEDALSDTSDMLQNINYYCNQGSSDTLSASDRSAIVENLQAYRDQIYDDGNADYDGRSIFTGYKTDKTLTFQDDENNTKYSITEVFDENDFDTVNKVIGGVSTSSISEISSSDMPQNITAKRIRLSYDGLDTPSSNLNLTYVNGTTTSTIEVTTVSATSTSPNPYQPGDDEIYFVPETGELIFGRTAYSNMQGADQLRFTYDKTGFEEGDLRPENYFNCTDAANPDHPYTQYEEDPDNSAIWRAKNQDINYTINFNQELKVNTEAKDVYVHGMARDIDEMLQSVNDVTQIEDKISKLSTMLSDSAYSDEDSQSKLNSMIEAANKELAFAEDNMQKMFESGLTKFSKYQSNVDLAVADVGSRVKRLELNESRLEEQKLTFEDLKSKNEDVDTTEVYVKYAAAQNVYDASLTAVSKIVQQSLLDFI